ncbi:hypothetical protein C5167_031248 [Papaver somniferum]|nr:hypothetical protein C5167_031248 [Papaver somniferum]
MLVVKHAFAESGPVAEKAIGMEADAIVAADENQEAPKTPCCSFGGIPEAGKLSLDLLSGNGNG